MKKMRILLAMMAFAGAAVFASCSDSDDPDPSFTLTANPTSLEFAKDETTTKPVVLTTDATGAITETSDAWITVNINGKNATVRVSANDTGAERNGTITFKVNGAKDATVAVKQTAEAKPVIPSLKVAPSTGLTFEYNETTDAKVLTVTAENLGETAWTVKADQAWILPVRDGETNKVNVKVTANSTEEVRNGNVIFEHPLLDEAVSVPVTQNIEPPMIIRYFYTPAKVLSESEFHVTFTTINQTEDLWLEGWTDNQTTSEFYLKNGTYTVGTGATKLKAGNVTVGSDQMITRAGSHYMTLNDEGKATDVWNITSASLVISESKRVEESGEFFNTFLISGTITGKSIADQKTYTKKITLHSEATPMGMQWDDYNYPTRTIEFTDVTAGNYAVNGTPETATSPTSWTMALSRGADNSHYIGKTWGDNANLNMVLYYTPKKSIVVDDTYRYGYSVDGSTKTTYFRAFHYNATAKTLSLIPFVEAQFTKADNKIVLTHGDSDVVFGPIIPSGNNQYGMPGEVYKNVTITLGTRGMTLSGDKVKELGPHSYIAGYLTAKQPAAALNGDINKKVYYLSTK